MSAESSRAGPGGRRPGARRRRLAALDLASAHLDADRADPAVPAGHRQRAGIGAAAGGHRPLGGQPVLHLASGAGPDPEQAVAVQRVRGALVRGHLPAAVPVAGRLRAAPDLQAGRLGPAAAAPRAPAPEPAADVDRLPDARARRTRHWHAAAQFLGRRRYRLRTGDGWVVGREGLPARGRQPAVPHRAAGPAGLGRARRHLRLQGQPAAGRRPVLRRHADRAGRVPPRPAGQRRGPGAVLGRP